MSSGGTILHGTGSWHRVTRDEWGDGVTLPSELAAKFKNVSKHSDKAPTKALLIESAYHTRTKVSTFNEEKAYSRGLLPILWKLSRNFVDNSNFLPTQPLAFSSKELQLKVPLEVVQHRNTFLRPKLIDANQICLSSPNLS